MAQQIISLKKPKGKMSAKSKYIHLTGRLILSATLHESLGVREKWLIGFAKLYN